MHLASFTISTVLELVDFLVENDGEASQGKACNDALRLHSYDCMRTHRVLPFVYSLAELWRYIKPLCPSGLRGLP